MEFQPVESDCYTKLCAGLQTAATGDPCAMKLRDHSLYVWSTLAVNLIHAYDPEIVILGGGIMASADLLLFRA